MDNEKIKLDCWWHGNTLCFVFMEQEVRYTVIMRYHSTDLQQRYRYHCNLRHRLPLTSIVFAQCCGTGTAGTAILCLSGTRTGIYYGSSSGSGSGTGFRAGSNIKMEF
jgi:hypothetical protein